MTGHDLGHSALRQPRQTHALIGSPAAVAKMLADCEVLYTPVFLAWANMGEGFLL